MRIWRKNTKKVWLGIWRFLEFLIKKKKGEEERRTVLLLDSSFEFFWISRFYIIFNIKNQIRSNFYHKKLEKIFFSQRRERKRKMFSLIHGKLRRKGSSLDLYCIDQMHGSRKKMKVSLFFNSVMFLSNQPMDGVFTN